MNMHWGPGGIPLSKDHKNGEDTLMSCLKTGWTRCPGVSVSTQEDITFQGPYVHGVSSVDLARSDPKTSGALKAPRNGDGLGKHRFTAVYTSPH